MKSELTDNRYGLSDSQAMAARSSPVRQITRSMSTTWRLSDQYFGYLVTVTMSTLSVSVISLHHTFCTQDPTTLLSRFGTDEAWATAVKPVSSLGIRRV